MSSKKKDDDDEFLPDEDANDIAPSRRSTRQRAAAPKKADEGKGKAKSTFATPAKRPRTSSTKDDDNEFVPNDDDDAEPSRRQRPSTPAKGAKGKEKAPAAVKGRPSSPQRKSGHEADDEADIGNDSDDEALGQLDGASQEEQANLRGDMMQTCPSASVMAGLANDNPMPRVEPAVLAKVFERRAAEEHAAEMAEHERDEWTEDEDGVIWSIVPIPGSGTNFHKSKLDGRRKYSVKPRPTSKELKDPTLLTAAARSFRR